MSSLAPTLHRRLPLLGLLLSVLSMPAWSVGYTLSHYADISPSAFADLNGDGRIDGVQKDTGGVRVQLYPYTTDVFYALPGNPSEMVLADFTGDGHTDIAATDGSSLYLLPGNGDGTFNTAALQTLAGAGINVEELTVARLDADAKADLVFKTNTGIRLWKSTSGLADSHIVDSELSYLSYFYINRFQVKDVDGDNLDDIVATGGNDTGDGPEYWLRVDAGAGISHLLLPEQGENIFIAPLVGSLPDIVVNTGEVVMGSLVPLARLVLNNGSGLFSLGGNLPVTLVIGDVDLDGKRDLIERVSDQSPSQIRIHRNLGGGTFLAGATYDVADYLSHAYVADLDLDGKPDIVTVSQCSGECDEYATLLLGHSDGSFAAGITHAFSNGRTSRLVDVDQNGYLDLLGDYQGFSVLYGSSGGTPIAFTFTAHTGVAANTPVESNVITISGISESVPISIIGGEYAVNGAPYTSAAGTVVNGDTIQIRLTSAASPGATAQAVLTVGTPSITAIFSVTTQGGSTPTPPPPPGVTILDTTPDTFRFVDQDDIPFGAVVESNSITVSGIETEVSIAVTGGEYRIGSGPWTSSSGKIAAGQSVVVRVKAGDSFGQTRQVTLSIGGVADSFSVTTPRAVTTTEIFNHIGTPAEVTITDLDPHTQNVKLPKTRCAKTDAYAATGYSFDNLTVAGEADRSGNPPTLQTVPVKYGSTDLLAPAVLGGLARISTRLGNQLLLSIATCDQSDVGYFRSQISFNADAATATLAVLRLTDGRLKVAVESGSVVYQGRKPTTPAPVAAFKPQSAAEVLARNQFTAVLPDLTGQDITLEAGEVAEFDANGRLFQIRIGSLYGDLYPQFNPDNTVRNPTDRIYWWTPPYIEAQIPAGDQVGLYDNGAPLSFSVLVPKLNARLQRLAGNLDTALGKVLQADVIPPDPYRPIATWGLRLQYPNRPNALDWLPVGPARIEPHRADGAYVTGYAIREIVSRKVVVSLAPGLPSLERFARNLRAVLDPSATVEVAQNGVAKVNLASSALAMRTDGDNDIYNPNLMVGCQSLGIYLYTCSGKLRYVEDNRVYTLHPAFVDFTALQDALTEQGANPALIGNDDGTVTVAGFRGGNATLVPDYNLIPLPPQHAGKTWYQGSDGRMYVVNRDGTAQGMGVK